MAGSSDAQPALPTPRRASASARAGPALRWKGWRSAARAAAVCRSARPSPRSSRSCPPRCAAGPRRFSSGAFSRGRGRAAPAHTLPRSSPDPSDRARARARASAPRWNSRFPAIPSASGAGARGKTRAARRSCTVRRAHATIRLRSGRSSSPAFPRPAWSSSLQAFLLLFHQTLFQPLDKKVPRQILADEDHGARALLVLPPGAAQVAAHQHVHALEHDPMRVALHVQDPLVAQHVRAVDLHDSGEEFLELRGVEGLVRAEHEGADVLFVLVLAVFQEIRVELKGRVEVEAADVENVLDRRIAEMHVPDRRARIHFREAPLELLLVGFRNEVGLRHENAVGEADLLLGLAELVELPGRVLGVHHGDDAVQEVVVADLLVDEEALRDRPRVRHSGGLDDDAVELELARVAPLFQLAKDADKVPAHGAAHAAVVHLDDLLAGPVQQDVVVHARLAELVLDHGDAPAVPLLEDAVDERRLAAPQEAGEYGHRNHVLLFRQPVL